MIWIGKEQTVGKEKIKEMLLSAGVEFTDLEVEDSRDIYMVEEETEQIKKTINVIRNQEALEKELAWLGVLLKHAGFEKKQIQVVLQKNRPEDYGEEYSLQIRMGQEVYKKIAEYDVEDLDEDWAEDILRDHSYDYVYMLTAEHIEMEDEEEYEIELPELQKVYQL